MKKLVLTGAAGRLGSYLREPLSKLCYDLVSTDINDVGKLYEGETFIKADLASFDDMMGVIEGADMVVHMGAFVDEGPFEQLLGPNFVGSYNVWEAAHKHGVRRVIYGSSIHAVGMYPKNEFIDTEVPHRPDTFYGLAKCFTEDLGRMYWEKRGLESVHMRILSAAQVNNPRALGSWLSYDDLIQLVTRCIDTPVTGFAIIYGVSNNDRAPVDNAKAAFLGYRPKDNAEQFAEQVLAEAEPLDPHDVGHMCHGGPFASVDLGNSGLAGMNVIDDTKKT
ncbi:NAD(P)-dependent oxidoreductase [Loktanella sp. F6476L]|uniref:NAD-dependent epimerase/dehydratase family protein n=1 Tax=Loktanella sp. F6476L TaxID=2926405 RepID=UPI001FF5E849|nr:NAD(P)-dependent oxidoreductase [Loktanella sp. F6476L]MCK0120286.1 NAD(P)-dependent oxidoreductase [Loktanella sp. F6476L]